MFCYHDVSDTPSEFSSKHHLTVPPALFEYQLNFVMSHFNIIGPDDLLEHKIPENAALISFDDGFKSFFVNAVPILEKTGIPCQIFLNMGPVLGDVFWSGLITYLCDKSPEFIGYLEERTGNLGPRSHLHLRCSEDTVNSYLNVSGEDFRERVSEYVGLFADESHLLRVADHPLIYFGNHLFNHYVPILMPDDEFSISFNKNCEELNRFSNSRNMFSFPFGQPGTCFSRNQVKLLLDKGVKRIFSSSGRINYCVTSPLLDRVSLDASHDSPDKIWLRIFRERLAHYPKRVWRIWMVLRERWMG